jgi:photosystem II stability/assembly factor-like uncharacterized protein
MNPLARATSPSGSPEAKVKTAVATRRLLALAQGGVASAQQAADGQWSVEKVLAGQDVRCLEVDPLDSQRVYAGTQGQGVFASADGGHTWKPLGLPGVIVKALAASPHQPGVIYAGTKSPALIYRTTDGGTHWEELAGFRRVRAWWWLSPAEPPFTAYVLALAISPEDPNIVLAGIEAGAVVGSADGGRTWSGHRSGAGRDCHQLLFHPRQPQWVYEAHGGGPVVSRDAGQTWQRPKAGLTGNYCFNVAVDAHQPEVWYAVTAPVLKAHSANARAAVQRSTGGAPWQPLAGGLPPVFDRLPLLASHPAVPGELYVASTQGHVWQSLDCGDNWQQLPLSLGPVWFRLIVT